jgi:hypothetical protein
MFSGRRERVFPGATPQGGEISTDYFQDRATGSEGWPEGARDVYSLKCNIKLFAECYRKFVLEG